MQEIDKRAMGARIREIRSTRGLRQRELARLLGTTQSAIHKYEHGVVPEPRRLMEIARVGDTTIEWILTGRHGAGGDDRRERLPDEVLRTAALLRQVEAADTPHLAQALSLLREASQALQKADDPSRAADPAVVRAQVREDAGATLRVLEAAWRIQRAVLQRIVHDTQARLEAASPPVPADRG